MITPIKLTFDSKTATDPNISGAKGTRDNPVFNLVPAIENAVGYSVYYVNVPFTYYVIDFTNNIFGLTIDGDDYTCSIEPGTYNAINLKAQIIAAMVDAGYTAAPTEFEIYVDNTDSKLVFYKIGDVALAFTLKFNVNASVAEPFGFDIEDYNSTSGTFKNNAEQTITSHFIKSPRVVNLSGDTPMYLSSDFGGAVYGKVRNQTANNDNIAVWPIEVNYQGTNQLWDTNPLIFNFSKMTISTISLKLRIGNRTKYNSKGIPTDYISLNGEAFQIGIIFYVEASQGVSSYDSMGNATRSLQVTNRSSVARSGNIRGQRF